MADDDKKKKPRHGSFEDTTYGIGQRADGEFNIFPASELPRLIAERDSQEQATDYAVAQSEQGFPDDAEGASDPDDFDKALADADADEDVLSDLDADE